MLKTLCVTVVFFALIGQSAQECSDSHEKIRFRNYDALACPDLIDAAPGACVSQNIRKWCCSSCERKKSSDPTCPYGDVPEVTVRPENGGRDSYMPCPDAIQAGLSCHQISWMCCATCKTLETGDPDCPYQDTPVGMYNGRGVIEAKNCSDYAGGHMCTLGKFKKHCCNLCKSKETGDADCPYQDTPVRMYNRRGELEAKNCSDFAGGSMCTQDQIKKQCCNACKSKETGDANCPYGDAVGPVLNVANKLYTCTELVAKSPRWCHVMSVQRDCCATCKNHPAGKRDVEEFEEADVLDIAEPTLVDWIVPEVVV